MSCCSAVLRNLRHDLRGRCKSTNLVIHDGVTNIIGQASQCLRILDIVEETSDFPPLCQRFQILERLFQFPEDLVSVSNLDLDADKLPSECLSPLYLLGLTLRSRTVQGFRESLNPGY